MFTVVCSTVGIFGVVCDCMLKIKVDANKKIKVDH